MGGIVGRLFREFAVTVTMTIVRLGVRLADPDADACARCSSRTSTRGRHGRLYDARRSGSSTAWSHGYQRGLDLVLRHQFADALRVPASTLAATGLPLRRRSPRASSRSRTPASSSAPRRRPRTSPSPRWRACSRQLDRDRAAGSRRRQRRLPSAGASGGNSRQHRPLLHHPEAARASATPPPTRSSRGCGRKLAQGRGRQAVPAGLAGHQCRRPPVAHAVPVHAAGPRPRRAERLGAEVCWRSCKSLPQLARRRDRPADRAATR